jgi:hypothetical protein
VKIRINLTKDSEKIAAGHAVLACGETVRLGEIQAGSLKQEPSEGFHTNDLSV